MQDTTSSAEQDRSIAAGQERALALEAQGESLQVVLGELTRAVESHSSAAVLASILLLDEDGKHLRHGAAPSLPAAYCAAIDGIAIGPTVGSCGTAAFSGNTIMVQDVATDPLWADFKDLALAHGLRACWSTPIRSPGGAVLGTFALYHREPRAPSVGDREIVERLSRTAGEIIERRRVAVPAGQGRR